MHHNSRDTRLVDDVMAGSVSAWHEFVDTYTALILSVVRKYVRDKEEIRTAYVDVLEGLYRGGLEPFDGSSSLSTWVVVVSRRLVVDGVRSRHGRIGRYRWLERLDDFERCVFRFYFELGWELRETHEAAQNEGFVRTIEDVIEAVSKVDTLMSRQAERRLMYDLYARSIGAESGRLMEYLDHVRDDRTGAPDQETEMIAQQALATAREVWKRLEALPALERQVLELRFRKGHSAKQVSEVLHLSDARTVYRVVDRALRRLREMAS